MSRSSRRSSITLTRWAAHAAPVRGAQRAAPMCKVRPSRRPTGRSRLATRRLLRPLDGAPPRANGSGVADGARGNQVPRPASTTPTARCPTGCPAPDRRCRTCRSAIRGFYDPLSVLKVREARHLSAAATALRYAARLAKTRSRQVAVRPRRVAQRAAVAQASTLIHVACVISRSGALAPAAGARHRPVRPAASGVAQAGRLPALFPAHGPAGPGAARPAA